MKDLQEMNLVDDFLVNSLTSHKIYGESASRYILECIFRRKIGKLTVVPQRVLCGENTGDHGIRLDVYLDEEAGELFDVEPDQNDSRAEKVSLPRRVRFYHAKIDPPRELRELLRYMEDSTEENARSEGLKALHRMVTEVKRDGEVGFAYMKSFEREQRVREEGRREGLSEGLSEGKAEALLTVLGCKGEVPEALQSKILSEKDLDLLNDWLLRALSCESIEEFVAALEEDS